MVSAGWYLRCAWHRGPWPEVSWPYCCNHYHKWLTKFLKHQNNSEIFSKFPIFKVPSSHLVATRGTSVGSVEGPVTGLQRRAGDLCVDSWNCYLDWIISKNNGKFLVLGSLLTNKVYCTSQRDDLMNRFPVMMTSIAGKNFLQFSDLIASLIPVSQPATGLTDICIRN